MVVTAKTEELDGDLPNNRGAGINYLCAECGALLYYSGIDGAYEVGAVSFPAKQPGEVASRLRECPRCGHKLNSDPDSDSVKVCDKNLKTFDSRRDVPIVLNRSSSGQTRAPEETHA